VADPDGTSLDSRYHRVAVQRQDDRVIALHYARGRRQGQGRNIMCRRTSSSDSGLVRIEAVTITTIQTEDYVH